MKFNEKYDIAPGAESLFNFKSKEEELTHEAKMIMFRFLSEFEKLNLHKPIKKKDLAQAIGTSASFITQLFQGDKLVSLQTLAKLQDAYDFTFEIQAKANTANYAAEVEQTYNTPLSNKNITGNEGFRIYKNIDYNKSNVGLFKPKAKLKVA